MVEAAEKAQHEPQFS